uniref:Uncharacterized protein n=1 Tax=Tanacetum cinerariifolium TaxID=118510 RepID=A0A699GZ05_TANCI|nr:hypothetical protein [Tanacetum cinerariifolium]
MKLWFRRNSLEKLFFKEEIEQENIQTSGTAKLPILKQVAQTVEGSLTPHIPGPMTADENEDLNMKFLRLLPSEWNTHVVVWRNKSDLDKIKHGICSTPSTNNNDDVSTVFGVSTTSPQVSTVNLSDATVYAFLANQPNGSQLEHEDLEQIHEDDLEEMDLKCQLALLSMRAKRHFVREYRVLRNQENITKNQEIIRRTVNVEDTSSKAMVEIDGASFDWSFMADDEAPSNMAFMAFPDIEISNEKDDLDNKIEKFKNASQRLDKLIRSQITDKSKKGLGYVSYDVVPPPHTVRFSPPRIDLSHTGLPEFAEPSVKRYGVKPIEMVTQTSSVKISKLVKEKMVHQSLRNGNQKEIMRLGANTIRGTRWPVNLKSTRRSFQKRTTYNNINFSQKVNTTKGKVNTARPNSAVLNAVRANKGKAEIYPTSLTLRSLMEGMLHLGEELKVNRVLVVKPHLKTLYELFRGITPALSFMRHFGCHVTILNSLDHIGKFDGKSNEGFFVGYSTNSKAFRVYKTRTRKVEENLHINFLENKPIIAGDGPKWLFDIDALTKSLNYVPVIACTNLNDFVGKGARFDAGQSSMETRPSQDYILPLWNDGSLFDSSSKESDGDNKDNDGPCKDSEIDNQERPNANNSTKDVNTAGPSINTASLNINTASPIVNIVRQSDGFFGANIDMRSLNGVEMDVKSAFMYGRIEEDVYVCQTLGFEDPEYPDKVYKVEKALYGLHQASRACQDKYIDEILRKFKYTDVKPASTPMDKEKALLKDSNGDDVDVDVHLYRSMIGSLMYLTSSRPDIMLVVCTCAKFQVNPKVSHLYAVKRIFRYLKGQPKLGLWYPRDSPFDLVAYTDSDYDGASLDKKSTSGGCQFLGCKIISW